MKAIRATFFIPQTPAAPAQELIDTLTTMAGGLTRSCGHGDYTNMVGRKISEPVYILDVLIPGTSDHTVWELEDLANKYRNDAQQEAAVYFVQGMMIMSRDTGKPCTRVPIPLRDGTERADPIKLMQVDVFKYMAKHSTIELCEPAKVSNLLTLPAGIYTISGSVGYWGDSQPILRVRVPTGEANYILSWLPQDAIVAVPAQ